jgi:hypothetical protein
MVTDSSCCIGTRLALLAGSAEGWDTVIFNLSFGEW